jgi:hypothetical protein
MRAGRFCTPCVRKCRQRSRHAIKQREALALLGGLQLLPVDDHAGGSVHRDVAEHVRVPVDHLRAHIVGDITDVESVVSLHRDGAVHEHLEQEVAELLAQSRSILVVDCLEHFVGLFEQIRAKAAMGLLAIPRASTGSAQTLHDLVERAHRVDCFVTHGRSAPQRERVAGLV